MKEVFCQIEPHSLVSLDTHVKPLFIEEKNWEGLDACIHLLGSDQGNYCLLYNQFEERAHLFRETDDGSYASVSYVENIEIIESNVSKASFYLKQRTV